MTKRDDDYEDYPGMTGSDPGPGIIPILLLGLLFGAAVLALIACAVGF